VSPAVEPEVGVTELITAAGWNPKLSELSLPPGVEILIGTTQSVHAIVLCEAWPWVARIARPPYPFVYGMYLSRFHAANMYRLKKCKGVLGMTAATQFTWCMHHYDFPQWL
jgi:hypothetical protein